MFRPYPLLTHTWEIFVVTGASAFAAVPSSSRGFTPQQCCSGLSRSGEVPGCQVPALGALVGQANLLPRLLHHTAEALLPTPHRLAQWAGVSRRGRNCLPLSIWQGAGASLAKEVAVSAFACLKPSCGYQARCKMLKQFDFTNRSELPNINDLDF